MMMWLGNVLVRNNPENIGVKMFKELKSFFLANAALLVKFAAAITVIAVVSFFFLSGDVVGNSLVAALAAVEGIGWPLYVVVALVVGGYFYLSTPDHEEETSHDHDHDDHHEGHDHAPHAHDADHAHPAGGHGDGHGHGDHDHGDHGHGEHGHHPPGYITWWESAGWAVFYTALWFVGTFLVTVVGCAFVAWLVGAHQPEVTGQVGFLQPYLHRWLCPGNLVFGVIFGMIIPRGGKYFWPLTRFVFGFFASVVLWCHVADLPWFFGGIMHGATPPLREFLDWFLPPV